MRKNVTYCDEHVSSRKCIFCSGGSVSTYHHRLKAEAFDNTVDVIELLLDPTDQAPNVQHLRVLHTFSSMTSLELLILQSVDGFDEFRQHDA